MNNIIIILSVIACSLVFCCIAPSVTPQCLTQIMPPRTVRSTQNAPRRHQENKAIAAAVPQKEMDAKKNNGLKAANKDNPNVAVDKNRPHVVVSPPS